MVAGMGGHLKGATASGSSLITWPPCRARCSAELPEYWMKAFLGLASANVFAVLLTAA
jgi:hypothetical protein